MKNEQLRKHLKFTEKHLRRLSKLQKKLRRCGDGVFIEKNVKVLRYPQNVSIGDNVVLKEGARVCPCNETATVQIGSNTTIGYHTFIFSSKSIIIGDNCLIAPFVYLVDSDHEIDRDQLINEQPNQTSPIEIGNDVWLGTGAKILKGVKIGDGAVVAAGAIVSKDIAPYEIFGGIPAKKIGERK
ncbi:MAG: acyltransferase [Cyclobacteriaceae bacterium]